VAKLSGKNLYVSFAGVALSGEQRSFDVTLSQETADSTAGADNYRNFVNTVKSIEASLEIVMKEHSTGGSAIKAALAAGAEGTLLWGPEGTATGKPKYGFYALISEASETIPFDDVWTKSVTFQNAGTALLFDGVTQLWP
jgi:hypothetical protein